MSAIAAFLRHVGAGEIDRVRTMLAEDPSLATAIGPHPFWGGRPQALHVAIESKRHELASLLLEHGADVNGRNDEYDHWSPLMVAIAHEDEWAQHELLRRGATIGLLEALMLADDDRVAEQLSGGVLPAITPNAGSILAFARTPFAIDRLMALGAPTDLKDRWGSTPIDALSRLGPAGQPLVRHMIARGIAAAPGEYARLGDLETLQTLVANDPAVAALDAVMIGAVEFSHYDLVTWLIAHGGNVHARVTARSRQTALHAAAWNGDLPMVEILVRAGADVNARDDQYRSTPRGWAETSIGVSNNPTCADVVAYFDQLTGTR